MQQVANNDHFNPLLPKARNSEVSKSTRAGHFRYFFIFSIIKNDFFALFINLFLHQSYLKSPLPIKLTW